ncbi:hypothetical protein Cob_v002018 [Colletotrichum orbiculare MAFF 240422]|uniref:Uncharacterized protein n=1 Tax=Colletotrichum orbiculare (strain 104-T / ATCC 96160 / CBS 514.97 / LARS 414 / MAFF 240422) TaxID=1213857 RepID=A0A484G581_COLOR|nr:hypothetical protein Cob_v002018 [Colletotrichum orbiculare MAFF 240422]
MRFSALVSVFTIFVSAVAAQRGIGGECRDDRDCIRCLANRTPLICKTDVFPSSDDQNHSSKTEDIAKLTLLTLVSKRMHQAVLVYDYIVVNLDLT